VDNIASDGAAFLAIALFEEPLEASASPLGHVKRFLRLPRRGVIGLFRRCEFLFSPRATSDLAG
jgi:hypothetical protein